MGCDVGLSRLSLWFLMQAAGRQQANQEEEEEEPWLAWWCCLCLCERKREQGSSHARSPKDLLQVEEHVVLLSWLGV